MQYVQQPHHTLPVSQIRTCWGYAAMIAGVGEPPMVRVSNTLVYITCYGPLNTLVRYTGGILPMCGDVTRNTGIWSEPRCSSC